MNTKILEKPQKTIKWHQNPMKKKKKQPGNRQNSPYVLCNHLLSGLREVQVDEIGKQCHDEHRQTNEMRKKTKKTSKLDLGSSTLSPPLPTNSLSGILPLQRETWWLKVWAPYL